MQKWPKSSKSGLSCFNRFIKTLTTHLEIIANDFISRQTSGFVEGLNNKIKVLKRRGYGFTKFESGFFKECTSICTDTPFSASRCLQISRLPLFHSASFRSFCVRIIRGQVTVIKEFYRPPEFRESRTALPARGGAGSQIRFRPSAWMSEFQGHHRAVHQRRRRARRGWLSGASRVNAPAPDAGI
ncbi:transposase [Thiorhodococcus mannitoliphagus]|uniref:transposase n=1 Tax=Thiorhodococcus mannitoliphagus TaxID=329406 RepID=UPI003B83176F